MAILHQKSCFLYVLIVSCLNYRPNNAQIDSDIRGISADKNFGLSLWWEVRSEELREFAGLGEAWSLAALRNRSTQKGIL